MRFRSPNYSCRGHKCAQYPQLSIATSQSLKNDVVAHTERLGISISAWIRTLVEKELNRRTTDKPKNQEIKC